jgi:dTDP-glucose 4,6-dehydratase
MSAAQPIAVVTGGAGFLGSHVCDALIAAGTRVICVDSLLSGHQRNVAHLLDSPVFELRVADVAMGIPVDETVDLVVQCAGPGSLSDFVLRPIESLAAIGAGTLHALDLAARSRARFALVSTGEASAAPPDQDDGPGAVYVRALRLAEGAAAMHRALLGTSTSIIRTFGPYGPRMREDTGNPLPGMIRCALEGEPVLVPGSGSSAHRMCFVDDVVRAVLAVLSSGLPGPVDVSGDRPVPLAALAHRVLQITGSRSELVFAPLSASADSAPPASDLARDFLQWREETSLDDGLRSTVEYVRQRTPAVA